MFYKGYFLRELKNRFLCEVCIDGKNEICYISSSCRLSNFANFEGCEVLLTENDSKGRTRFTVHAIKYRRNYIIVDLKATNRVVYDNIVNRRFAYLGSRNEVYREKRIHGYKSDIYIKDTDTIIEIKSVISLDKNQMISYVYSERAINQLRSILDLLAEGKHVSYFWVATNKKTESMILPYCGEFTDLFAKCMENGMSCKGYSLCINKQSTLIMREIPIQISSE